ncbi:MAG: glycosyltransferase family 39 protein [Anaerolineae bacterium]|nr:glycosyltransferase family 39 protein [Anaerolineae bacterium]
MSILLVLLIAFATRLIRLGDKSVWWDEGLAAWAARQMLGEIARWTSADVHPPLYFWMLHFWRLGSGDTEFGLRAMSAGIGVLTVASVYGLGRAVGGRWVGLAAALLISVSRFGVWWAQEMRMYALAAFLSALSLWAAIRFWDRGSWRDGARYVLATTAGLYTLYLYASVLVVVNLVWLAVLWRSANRWRTFVRWAAAQALVLALFAPWLVYAIRRMPTWSSASPVAFPVFLRIYWTVLTLGVPTEVERFGWLTLPLLVTFTAGVAALLWSARRRWRTARDAGVLLIGLLLPAAVVYVVSLPRSTFFYSPQLAPRYLLVFAPAFYVLFAWGAAAIGQLSRRWISGVLVAFAVAAGVYGLSSYYPARMIRDDYKSLAATLHAFVRDSDRVVLYTDKDWPVFAYHHPGPWQGVPHAQQITVEWADAFLAPLWDAGEGVWLVVTPYAGINDPAGRVPEWLAEHAVGLTEYRYGDKALRFYARTDQRARLAHTPVVSGARAAPPVQIALPTGATLHRVERTVDTYYAGDTVHLFLYWQWEGERARETAFEVAARDAGGQVVGSVSGALSRRSLSGVERQQVDLYLPADVEPGTYALEVREEDGGVLGKLCQISVRDSSAAMLTAADVVIPHRLNVLFADDIRLLGYDLEPEALRPGETVRLTLYWQALAPVERRYKVFTHVLGEAFNAQAGGFVWGQQDNEPVHDTRPTSTWRIGEVIEDPYALSLAPHAPPGAYAIELGMYDPATGERLLVLDDAGSPADDRVLLPPLPVGAR